MHNKFVNMQKQNGAVLITSLIILVIMTVFGVVSMNTSLLQEKMATNAQNGNRVFQAAESAIGVLIEDVMDGNQGLLTVAMNAPSGQSSVIGYALDDPQVSAAYLVRYRGEITSLSGNSLNADKSSTILRGHRFELTGTGTIEGSNAQSIIRQGTEYR